MTQCILASDGGPVRTQGELVDGLLAVGEEKADMVSVYARACLYDNQGSGGQARYWQR